MAHTDARSRWLDHGVPFWSTALPISLLLLPFPYAMFAGLLGFLGLGLWQTVFYPGPIFSLLYRRGFIALGLLLIVSAAFANYPGEAFLQLTHFLPFFWFWAVLTHYLQKSSNPWQQIHQWALILVFTAIPINLVGIYEYALKMSSLPNPLTRLPLLDWLYIGDLHIPRAYSLFDYPNTLASYLVMILGLNLGLIFLKSQSSSLSQSFGYRLALGLNLLLTLACLFCSGSRNGYLVAMILLLISFFVIGTNRWVRSLGLAGIAMIIATTLRFGMAGRTPSWDWFTHDPRVHVWGLALQMIRDRPILGQGLGNYKLLYDGEVPLYDYIAHAHNFWLSLASEAGLPVMVLFTLAIGVIWYRGLRALWRIRKYPNPYFLLLSYHLCFLSMTLFSIFDVTLTEARVNLVAWLSLSVIYAGTTLSQQLKAPS
jgi:hypothetical protein